MKNILAMVLAGGRVDELSVLTVSRPKSAVPFGGMYRVIDFPLSNLMHSGIERVGILSQYRSISLLNHIGIGSWWDFVGRDRGAMMLPPSTGYAASDWYKGTADSVYQNLSLIEEQNPEIVFILSGDHVYKMNYKKLINYHREKDADLTVAFVKIDKKQSSRFGAADLDDEDGEIGGRILDYKEKSTQAEYPWASMTIFLFRPRVLYQVLKENAQQNSHEFGRDIIPEMLKSNFKVYGYKFYDYWAYARTIDEYWQTSMDLLGDEPKIDLTAWQVRTNLDHDRLRDRTPAKIEISGEIENSLVHNGCSVGGEVCNSVLFPGVRVEKNAVVKNSILLFDTFVESRAVVDSIITDVEVTIGAECVIGEGEDHTPNREFPELLSSGITLIGRGIKVPKKARLGRNCIIYPSIKETGFKEQKIPSGMLLR
ncbi:glucose-1-phosphate adenylyltransferase [bacterium]|nr:glucose-1-phosphate adenylyltransferase [bacterium]